VEPQVESENRFEAVDSARQVGPILASFKDSLVAIEQADGAT
jgi:hypothetical protein